MGVHAEYRVYYKFRVIKSLIRSFPFSLKPTFLPILFPFGASSSSNIWLFIPVPLKVLYFSRSIDVFLGQNFCFQVPALFKKAKDQLRTAFAVSLASSFGRFLLGISRRYCILDILAFDRLCLSACVNECWMNLYMNVVFSVTRSSS